MDSRRTLRQQRDTARAQRDDMAEQRDDARKAADTERFNARTLARQIAEVRDELDALRKDPAPASPAPADWETERRGLRRALMLSERARASLTAQLATVQAANEALCREAIDRSGTLARGVSR